MFIGHVSTVKPKISSDLSSPVLQTSAQNVEISFDKICFEYVYGQNIPNELSFTVPAGQNVAIVGGE